MTLESVASYDQSKVSETDGTAVVVGASMSGLLAARVLTDVYDEVTVIERDPLPDEVVARRGVPQANHVHILLEAGQSILDDLFPGYGEKLLSEGGLMLDYGGDRKAWMGGDYLADTPRRIPAYFASRPLFEYVARRGLAEMNSVTIRDNCQFTAYRVDPAKQSIEGIEYRDEENELRELAADLTVDATGRSSKTASWLEEHGYDSPDVDEVTIDLAYSSVYIERPPDERKSYLVAPTPSQPRAGAAVPVEDNRWLVTLIGMHGDHPPSEPEAFEEYARSLPTNDIAERLATYPRISNDSQYYPFPSNLRRRYERLDRFPDGLLVVGDAITSFNPIYAQGISVAALESLVLHHELANGMDDDLAHQFFDGASDVIDMAWRMSVGPDFQYPETTGPKPEGTDFLNWYVGGLVQKAHNDGQLAQALYRVTMMDKPPEWLLEPDIKEQVLEPSW